MNNKLFVAGLSWNTDSGLLREAFEKFGEVSDAQVITDRQTGRSRGFGFVTFEEGESASRAVSEMNGKELDGRTIKVNEAEEKPQGFRSGGGDRNSDRGGDRGRSGSSRGGSSNSRW